MILKFWHSSLHHIEKMGNSWNLESTIHSGESTEKVRGSRGEPWGTPAFKELSITWKTETGWSEHSENQRSVLKEKGRCGITSRWPTVSSPQGDAMRQAPKSVHWILHMQVTGTTNEIILAKWQKRKPSFNALKNKKRYNQVEKANTNYALLVLTRF